MFSGLEKGCIGNRWVNSTTVLLNYANSGLLVYYRTAQPTFPFNGNNRTMCELAIKLALKLAVKQPERRQLYLSGVIVNFERISRIVLAFPLLTLNK